MKFWELYRTVLKRKWMILGLMVATLASIWLATAGRQKTYEAIAQVMPSDAVIEKPILWRVTPGTEQGQAPRDQASRDSQMATLMSLVSSRTVAQRTIDTLGLDTSVEVLQGNTTIDRAPSPAPTPDKKTGTQTDIIRIFVRDTDSDRAIRTANGIAMTFANYYQELSHENAMTNSRFLEEEMARASATLDDSQTKLRRYKEEKGLSVIPEGMQASVTGITQMMEQRDQAEAQLAETRQRLANIDGQLRHEPTTTSIQEGTTDSPLVQQLETQVATLKTRLVEAQSKYQDIHPIVTDLKSSLASTQAKLDGERGKLRMHTNVVSNPIHQNLLVQKSQLEADARGFSARVSKLDAAVSRARSGFVAGGDVQLARLQQEFMDAQTMASMLRQKLYQARIDEKDTSATGAIRIVDRAMSTTSPTQRSRAAFMAMGLILSLIFGVGLAIGLDSIDNRIKSNSDLEQLLSLPVNALIPGVPGRKQAALPTVTYLDPLSPVAEAYRFLRTDLLLTAAQSGVKTVMVATAKPGQGGTTTVANLAIALAMDGKRVILVDADMRRPMQHGIFKVPNDFGLSTVLSGEKDLDEVLQSTEIQNLTILPGGPPPLNPSELLGSARMRDVTERLSEMADFVLFDTPSAVAFTDTIVLTKWIDGVLMVVRANQVPRGAELQVRNLFNKANVRILGVVLNDVEASSVDSAYYHSHYYPTGSTQLALQGGKGGERSKD